MSRAGAHRLLGRADVCRAAVLPAGSELSAMCSNPAADWLGMFRPGSALHSRVFLAECSILCPSVAVCCLPPCLMPDTVCQLPLACPFPVSTAAGLAPLSLCVPRRLTEDGLCSLRLRQPCEWEGVRYEAVTAVDPVPVTSGGCGRCWCCWRAGAAAGVLLVCWCWCCWCCPAMMASWR